MGKFLFGVTIGITTAITIQKLNQKNNEQILQLIKNFSTSIQKTSDENIKEVIKKYFNKKKEDMVDEKNINTPDIDSSF